MRRQRARCKPHKPSRTYIMAVATECRHRARHGANGVDVSIAASGEWATAERGQGKCSLPPRLERLGQCAAASGASAGEPSRTHLTKVLKPNPAACRVVSKSAGSMAGQSAILKLGICCSA